MTYVIPEQPVHVSILRRGLIITSVKIAQLMQRLPPHRLRAILGRISAGAIPASYAEARQVRDEVLTVSALCRGGQACLVRSIATSLVCRISGVWPTWAVGVLTAPPFSAHAWIEADGEIVDEPLLRNDFKAFFTVSTVSNTT